MVHTHQAVKSRNTISCWVLPALLVLFSGTQLKAQTAYSGGAFAHSTFSPQMEPQALAVADNLK
jgi:hypothetical protein